MITLMMDVQQFFGWTGLVVIACTCTFILGLIFGKAAGYRELSKQFFDAIEQGTLKEETVNEIPNQPNPSPQPDRSLHATLNTPY